MQTVERFSLWTFGISVALAAIAWHWFSLDVLLAWLASVNLVTFLTFGYDKVIAGSGRLRVPEKVLLALTLVGGTAGAMIAMPLFRHKTVKRTFRYKFWGVVALQVLLATAYFLWYA